MQEFEIELSIGDTLQFGDQMLTVIDVDRGEITFRIDSANSQISAPRTPKQSAEANTGRPAKEGCEADAGRMRPPGGACVSPSE